MASRETITGLTELENHLDDAIQDSAVLFQSDLFDHVDLQLASISLTPAVVSGVFGDILQKLATLLRTTSHDPTLLADLTEKLITPLSFQQVLSMAGEDGLLAGLRSSYDAANLLAIKVIDKASESTADVHWLDSHPIVMEELLRRWLRSPHVGVGHEAIRVMRNLLKTDSNGPIANGSRVPNGVSRSVPTELAAGLLWRRLFGLNQPYRGLMVNICCGRDNGEALDPNQVTLAQDRVLRLLFQAAELDLAALSDTGILETVILHLIDLQDRIMKILWIDFFKGLFTLLAKEHLTAEVRDYLRRLTLQAIQQEPGLEDDLRRLPSRTAEEERDTLRIFIESVMGWSLES